MGVMATIVIAEDDDKGYLNTFINGTNIDLSMPFRDGDGSMPEAILRLVSNVVNIAKNGPTLEEALGRAVFEGFDSDVPWEHLTTEEKGRWGRAIYAIIDAPTTTG